MIDVQDITSRKDESTHAGSSHNKSGVGDDGGSGGQGKGRITRLVVKANQSMSWKANMWLAASLAAVCLSVAFSLAAFGFWMIIPFAGAEVLFIVVCLHWTIHKLSRKEVITVDENAIQLEWGYKKPDETVKLPRQWSTLRYHCPDSPFEVGHLSLAAHGKHYALGQCLGRDEKKTLYQELDLALRQA